MEGQVQMTEQRVIWFKEGRFSIAPPEKVREEGKHVCVHEQRCRSPDTERAPGNAVFYVRVKSISKGGGGGGGFFFFLIFFF